MDGASIAALITAITGAAFGAYGLWRATRQEKATEEVGGFEALVSGFKVMFEEQRSLREESEDRWRETDARLQECLTKCADCEEREMRLIRRIEALES